ncbi:MAG: T9SS type A sorting domain-containing protein [Bacteroidaceae bacterium]|nr:T9SS type A sorting domain-containing protein [Bacteroidaceae bacterium]
MKKFLLFLSLCALGFSAIPTVQAQNEVYDFTPFSDSNFLELFYNAQQAGREYPTAAEFEAAGFNKWDLEFVRSHVRPRALIDDQASQLLPSVKNTRRLWMNLPMGTAKGIGGFPGTNVGDDTYSLWNYTHLFGSWNHGLFSAPGAWVDAAHQNGTDILSGIKFFESWTAGSGDKAYSKLITEKNVDGSFKYVKPLISILQYLGADGINYNWEDNSYSQADVVAFHKALYKEAEARGFKNFHVGIYTSLSSLTAQNANYIFGNSEGRTADAFLNYSNGNFISSYAMSNSETAANNALGTTDGLYAGAWIVTMNRSWTNLSGRNIGAVLWGEHANSRFWSNNTGNDSREFQENYQALLERAMSGGNRNPANRPTMRNTGNEWGWNGTTPPLSTFGGLATYFPERSTLQGKLPFHTYFNTGVGEVYNYKGKQTHTAWYNLSSQDLVPTYRWLVYNAGTTTVSSAIQPNFTVEDSYMGGSCLRLEGTATATGTDIVMFRTRLTGNSGQPYAKVAVKTLKEGETPTHLYLILKVGEEWKEYAVGSTSGAAWEEKKITLDGLTASSQIDYIGLRVKGDEPNYKVLVGNLQLNDAVQATPAPVKDLVAEVKKETKTMLSVKLIWDVNQLGASPYGLTYNDEANIDHFEVLYKNGADGRVSVVSHVQGWSAFVGNKLMATDEDPWFGVRAVSTDMKTYGEPVWVQVGRNPNAPAGAATGDVVYGESVINSSADGYQTAIASRYLTSVTTTGATTQDLAYEGTKCPDNTNYIDATNNVLKVNQGDEITLSYVWNNASDGLQWCIMKAYADWNIDGNFSGGGDELIVEQGTPNTNNSPENVEGVATSPLHANGYSRSPLVPFTFKVPDDAVRGITRIRIVFTDAWAAHPGATGLTAKGFTLDLGVEVSGNNEERHPVITRDQGVADEPEASDLTGIKPVSGSGVASQAQFVEGKLELSNVEKAWVYSADGKLVMFANANPRSLDVARLAKGTYVVKMQNKGVVRSYKFAK